VNLPRNHEPYHLQVHHYLLHLGFSHLPTRFLLCLSQIHPSPAKMPRDLLADKRAMEGMPELSREPETVSSPEPQEFSLVPHRSSNVAQENRLKQMGVRPYAQLLNVDDLDDCDWLEHAAFDANEAATREKVRCLLHYLSLYAPCPFPTSQYHRWAPSGIQQCALLHLGGYLIHDTAWGHSVLHFHRSCFYFLP
jgi:hypothetical protein